MNKCIIVIGFIVMCTFLGGCGFVEGVIEEAQNDIEWSQEHNAYTDGKKPDLGFSEGDTEENKNTEKEVLRVGDACSFTNGDTTLEVTVTETGSAYSSLYDRSVVYFSYTIENTGNKRSTVGDFFSAYNDDIVLEKDYAEEDSFMTVTIDPGRKCNAKTYLLISPNEVGRLEIQIDSVVWLLSALGNEDGTSANVEVVSEYVECENLKGRYIGKDDSNNMTLDLHFDGNTDRDDLGVYSVTDSQNGLLRSGRIVSYGMNCFSLFTNGVEVARVYVTAARDGKYELYYEDTKLDSNCYLIKME